MHKPSCYKRKPMDEQSQAENECSCCYYLQDCIINSKAMFVCISPIKTQGAELATMDTYTKSIGNGDSFKGIEILSKIDARLSHARSAHEFLGDNPIKAVQAILSEVNEFSHAVAYETKKDAYNECLDVIATCIRFLNEEYGSGNV